jgi:hypothetical protein
MDRLPLPLQATGERWTTVRAERTVLGVVHNVTSATRLLDLLSVFDGDQRVQTVFTRTGSSALDQGTAEFLRSRGIQEVPWHVAVTKKFDLAITASRGGDLQDLHAPIVSTSHGAGYNKKLDRKPETGNRKPETGNRQPETGNRKPETGNRHSGSVMNG